MAKYRKNAKNPVRVHGLAAHMERWQLDGRLGVVKAMKRAREGLRAEFPGGMVNAPAALLIDRIVYKSLKLAIFESMDLRGADLAPNAHESYLRMSNSLREDLRILANLAGREAPADPVPDLQEYLKRKAAEAVPVGPKENKP